MIAIKGMEMPKTCTMCWLSPMCKVHGDKPEWLGYNTRVDGCPLVEIVTCVDCKHRKRQFGKDVYCQLVSNVMPPDGFCSMSIGKEGK